MNKVIKHELTLQGITDINEPFQDIQGFED